MVEVEIGGEVLVCVRQIDGLRDRADVDLLGTSYAATAVLARTETRQREDSITRVVDAVRGWTTRIR